MKRVFGFIKKNKLRFAGCIALDILFIIVFILLIMNYVPQINEHILVFNDIMQESGTSLTQLSTRASQMTALQSDVEDLVGSFMLWLLVSVNIIYAGFFGLLFKKLKSWFIVKYIALNAGIQFVLWILFGMIVHVKGLAMGAVVTTEQTKSSMVVFILLAYIIYFFSFVFMVEMREKKAYKKTKKILKKKGGKLFLKYVIVNVLFIVIMLLTQAPMLMDFGKWVLLILMLIGIVVFVGYMTLSKIYLVEEIRK